MGKAIQTSFKVQARMCIGYRKTANFLYMIWASLDIPSRGESLPEIQGGLCSFWIVLNVTAIMKHGCDLHQIHNPI